MHIPSLIEKKREGQELTADEITYVVSGFTHGEIPDYQMSAWAMAVFFRGMTTAETQHLTTAMMESGSVLEYPEDSPPKVDKHSTGGIGDKVSLVLAPSSGVRRSLGADDFRPRPRHHRRHAR